MSTEITWDRPMLRRFKKACMRAAGRSSPTFEFEGNIFNKVYATYLLQYLTTVLQENR